jgi:predicted chitinase
MITKQLLASIFPGTKKALRDRFVDPLNRILPKYGITTKARVAAFMATGGIETDYLRTTTEYASGADYEGRRDLGNTQEGDGVNYKGRGFFQTTGRFNYMRVVIRFVKKLTGIDYGDKTIAALVQANRLGVNFIKEPKRLAELETAIESACIFWEENNLSRYADRGDFFGVSGIVNRGSAKKQALHWSKRKALYELCLTKISNDFSIEPDAAPAVLPSPSAELSPAAVDPSPAVVPTPTETDDFLTNALDKNVSAEDVKNLAREKAPSLLGTIGRPFAWLITALEAGNVYAWLGVGLFVVFVAVELYIHRARVLKLWDKLKAKITS